MSKDRNYIIVLGGIFVIIGIIVFGVVKYFIFGVTDINSQAMDFLIFTIPSILGASLIIVSILNLVEKKDLKAVTKLNTEYSTKFIEKLESIETTVFAIRESEIDREEEVLEKEKKHIEVHEEIDSKIKALKNIFNEHIENHN